ncbi:hypothetical protein BDN71DRAFT_1513931 [Pleurotus eryngii]|uniref:Uncharacterized protein n=1 Tax=Pleurotus eryngii TaxID=5323 RepID=A0A9P6D0D4_PLEER|nr:hypothetical protein BDN71DRAFT_1513931 [Pleurotus eryngii]
MSQNRDVADIDPPIEPKKMKYVTCYCRSHCTKWNPQTHCFVGDGKSVSHATRDNHAQDDKRLRIRSKSEEVAITVAALHLEDMGSWVHLATQEVATMAAVPSSLLSNPLIFINSPTTSGEYDLHMDPQQPNTGIHALRTHAQSNTTFIHSELCVAHLLSKASSLAESQEVDTLISSLEDYLRQLDSDKKLHWSQQRNRNTVDRNGRLVINTGVYFESVIHRDSVQQVVYTLSAVMQNFYFVPRKALRLQIVGNQDLLIASGAPCSTLSFEPMYLVQPATPFIHVTRMTSPRVIAPDVKPHKAQPAMSRYGKSPLLEDVPGLSRVEEILDGYPAGLNATRQPISDIWLADIFQQLKDHEGNPFLSHSLVEGCLVFGLSVDSFEPNSAKPGQTPSSATGIWIVCYNFPPHLRYLPKNIYLVGIIPAKPDTTHINPYIQLVVDKFKPFWHPGVTFSWTGNLPNGRSYLALLIPLICDMLGAWQVTGKPAAMAHNLCTICDIDHDDMDLLDPSKWPPKDRQQLLFFAKLWKNARCTAHQSQIFDVYGQCWSPLFDLPYWDPIRFVVIDMMHTLDINLLKGHLRDMFQINLKHQGGDGTSHTTTVKDKMNIPKTYVAKLPACKKLIAEYPRDLLYKLLEFHHTILYVICVENTILGVTSTKVIGTRWILAQNIARWQADELSPSVQRFLQQQVPVQAITLDVTVDEPSGMWLSDSDDEDPQDVEPNKIEPTLVGGVIGVDTTDPAQMVNESLDAQNVERPHLLLVQEKKLHSTIRKILTYLGSNTNDLSCEQVSQRSTIDILRHICRLIGINASSVATGCNVKLPLVDAIIEKGEETVTIHLASFLPEKDMKRTPVLGIDIMKEIWQDMQRTMLPTWTSHVPHDWVSLTDLSASQTRTLCTVHLPITLIRLWHTAKGQMRDILANFMDLVTAIVMANMRTTSQDQIAAYDFHIVRYMQQAHQLYPDVSIKPVHHAALHVGRMLEDFGPVHSHSSPYYECYINFLHRMNTNQKLGGQLESTLMVTSARNANLSALLADNTALCSKVSGMVDILVKFSQEDPQRLARFRKFEPVPELKLGLKVALACLDDHYHQLLCRQLPAAVSAPRSLSFYDEIMVHGITYSCAGTSKIRNSLVIFHPAATMINADTPIYAGAVEKIFHYTPLSFTSIFLEIRSFRPVDSGLDSYKKYGFAGGFLCFRNVNDYHVIPISAIISHCALTSMGAQPGQELVHVLPLNRLRQSFEGS